MRMRPQHSRRALLKTASTAALAAVAPRLSSDPLGIVPGVQLYTVGADLLKDTSGTLQRISVIGYV